MPSALQVAYCGLFCGDCIIRRGKIGKRCGDLLRTIDAVEFRKLCVGLPIIAADPFKPLAKSTSAATCWPRCRSSTVSGRANGAADRPDARSKPAAGRRNSPAAGSARRWKTAKPSPGSSP